MLSALISLESTINDGNNYNVTYTRTGTVQVSNLECYFHDDHCAIPATSFTRAHAYGVMSSASQCGNYSTVKDVINSQYLYRYYCRRDRREFAHRFVEYNMNDTQKSYPHFTKRIITASSGDCIEYNQTGDPSQVTIGAYTFWKFTYANDSFQDDILIPTSSLGLEGTTYIYPGSATPAEASKWGHGPRGLWMLAYKNPGSDGPKFYKCPVTISNVSDAEKPEHNVTDNVARTAVASIALQSQWYQGNLENPDWKQYQFYATG